MSFGQILAGVSLAVMVVATGIIGITGYFANQRFRCPGVEYEKISTAASIVAVAAVFMAVIGGALTL